MEVEYMDIYETMMNRRSIRNFSDANISDDIVERLLGAANNAPSGGNIQPLSIILVKDKNKRNKLAEIVGNQPWVANAPLSMIFCIDFNRVKNWAKIYNTEFKGEQSFSHFLIAYADILCAAQNIVILAESYGLGSVYIGSILESINEAREIFSLPQYVLPLMILSLGYPKSKPEKMPKLKQSVIVHNNEYHEMSDEEVKKAFDEKYGDFGGDPKEYFKKAYIEVLEAEKQGNEDIVSLASEKMKKLNIANNAQFLFKLRYPTDVMVKLNDRIFEAFSSAGYDFS
ncbi:MAG: nitroreductase family protein [Bacteroidales bacterium]|jgi:nitroreductase